MRCDELDLDEHVSLSVSLFDERTLTLSVRRWHRRLAPIVEAFFHVRFFLEMAVRYAAVDALPRPLPSGYAALLYLYQLR